MKKGKVGIITILKVNNYGAELQAFALQRKLNLMGYDAEIIDYLFYKHKDYRKEKIARPFYSYPFKKKIKEKILPIYEWLRNLPYCKALNARNKGFEDFHCQNTRFSQETYTSYSQLYNKPPEYDFYCVGSDQVWNPYCYTSLNPYFLTFVSGNKKKVSYASSFGVAEIPGQAVESYRSGLKDFDHISVREETGAAIVKRIIGKDAIVVADPTLLLSRDEWLRIAKFDKVPQEDYLLLYVLKDSNYITKIAQKIAKEYGFKIVRICKSTYRQDSKRSGILDIIDAAPDDFVGLFSRAKMVLTNSFHGTVFSNIFHRDFYSVLPIGKDNNSRIVDLLNKIGNQPRLIYEGTDFKETLAIDWNIIDEEIEKLVQLSEHYIYESFQ